MPFLSKGMTLPNWFPLKGNTWYPESTRRRGHESVRRQKDGGWSSGWLVSPLSIAASRCDLWPFWGFGLMNHAIRQHYDKCRAVNRRSSTIRYCAMVCVCQLTRVAAQLCPMVYSYVGYDILSVEETGVWTNAGKKNLKVCVVQSLYSEGCRRQYHVHLCAGLYRSISIWSDQFEAFLRGRLIRLN